MRGSDFAELRAFAAVRRNAQVSGARRRSSRAIGVSIEPDDPPTGSAPRGAAFESHHASAAPTPGRLYERITPTALLSLDSAVAEARTATGRVAGTLRINALAWPSEAIAPRLGRFHAAHPDVVLDIVIDDGLTDIVAGRFDAGIRVGQRLEQKEHDRRCADTQRPDVSRRITRDDLFLSG